MVTIEPWSVRDILDYLNEFRATIRMKSGQLALDVPSCPLNRYGNPVDRAKIVAKIMPHLKARKGELQDYFNPLTPVEPIIQPRRSDEVPDDRMVNLTQPLQLERDCLIEAFFDRADKEGKRLWWFTGLPLKMGFVLRKIGQGRDGAKKEIPLEANYICVDNDTKWTPLPVAVLDRIPRAKKKENQSR